MDGRVLAVDVGARRVGLAISDASCTLARPLETIAVDERGRRGRSRRRGASTQLGGEDDGIATIVVGMPAQPRRHAVRRRPRACCAFIARLKGRTLADDRHRGRAADEPRSGEPPCASASATGAKRKKQLDAAAAAVILQDYLDRRT